MSTKLTATELHDAVVEYLATERFSPPGGQFFPGGFYPSWRTYANSPVHQMPIPHRILGDIYPDVVIVDSERGNLPMVIIEVETEDSLNPETVCDKWLYDIECSNMLYLYVPEGTALKAAELCLESNKMHMILVPKGIRTYGRNDDGTIRITAA